MGRYEAEQVTGRIRANFEENRRLIREMYDREGWKALKCRSFEDWWLNFLQQSRNAMYYWKAACRIEDHINGDLSTMVDKPTLMPECTLRPFAGLLKERTGFGEWGERPTAWATRPRGSAGC